MPREVAELLGYRLGGGALGFVAGLLDPIVATEESFDVMLPGASEGAAKDSSSLSISESKGGSQLTRQTTASARRRQATTQDGRSTTGHLAAKL